MIVVNLISIILESICLKKVNRKLIQVAIFYLYLYKSENNQVSFGLCLLNYTKTLFKRLKALFGWYFPSVLKCIYFKTVRFATLDLPVLKYICFEMHFNQTTFSAQFESFSTTFSTYAKMVHFKMDKK